MRVRGPVPVAAGGGQQYYKKDFWSKENLKYGRPHYRLQKAAQIIGRLAGNSDRELLDVGCGPATLACLLPPNIRYYGIDISIPAAAQNLMEADFAEAPIAFRGMRFDIVLAQGVFEYMGKFQNQKFSEIAGLLKQDGIFVVSYVNFGHRKRHIYEPYNNVRPVQDFRRDLERYFIVLRSLPTSHNWNHGEPNRSLLKALNMRINVTVPFLSRLLAVEYFFICSPRRTGMMRPPLA